MATYQEQIEANRQKAVKADRAKKVFDRMCGSIADVLMPYIQDNTLTQDQAADLMTKLVKAVLHCGDNSP